MIHWFQTLFKSLHSPSELNLSLRYNSNFALGLGAAIFVMVILLLGPSFQGNFIQMFSDALLCGLVAIVIFGINISVVPKLLPFLFNEDKWTIGKDVLFTTWLFFIIGTFNMLLLRAMGWANFNLISFAQQQFVILLIGITPVTALAIIRNRQIATTIILDASKIQQKLLTGPKASLLLLPGPKTLLLPQPKITLYSEGSPEATSFYAEDLLVLHSEKGQLHLYWTENETVQYASLNLSFNKAIELLAAYDFVLRTHRFFLVNAKRVEKIEGNARGYLLSMPSISKAIPVSKTYLNDIKSYFQIQ